LKKSEPVTIVTHDPSLMRAVMACSTAAVQGRLLRP